MRPYVYAKILFLFTNHIKNYNFHKNIIFLVRLCIYQDPSNKQNSIHVVQETAKKRLLIMKRNEMMPFAATWMGLEIIILSEIS